MEEVLKNDQIENENANIKIFEINAENQMERLKKVIDLSHLNDLHRTKKS